MKVNVRTNVIVNVIRTVTMTVLSFITFPWVCRILRDQALGFYTWAATFVYYFTVLGHISLPNVAIREIVKYRNDPDKMSLRVQEVFIIESVMTLLSFALMSGIILVLDATHALPVDKNLVFVVSINFLIGVFSCEWLYIAFEKHVYMAIRSIILLALVDILIFAFVKEPGHVYLYAFLTISITILIVISNLIFLPRIFKFRKKEPYNFRQYGKLLAVLFFITFAVAVYEKTDTVILGFLSSGAAGVGSYAVGMKGVEIVVGVIVALTNVFMPRASYYWAHKDMRQFTNLNKYAVNIALFVTVPALATMTTLAEPITELISGKYEAAVLGYTDADKVLIALASFMVTHALVEIIYTQILIPTKREKYFAWTMIAGAASNVALSLLFGLWLLRDSPPFGVALATSISDLLVLLILAVIVRRDLRPILLNLNSLKIAGLGVLLGVFCYFVGPLLKSSFLPLVDDNVGLAYLLELVVTVFLAGVIYLTGLVLTREKLVASFIARHRRIRARNG